MGSEELILYRLDELKDAVAEVKDDVRAGRAEATAFREEHAKLEHRVDALEIGAAKAGQMSGGIAGGTVGIVVAVVAGVIEWIRSRGGA